MFILLYSIIDSVSSVDWLQDYLLQKLVSKLLLLPVRSFLKYLVLKNYWSYYLNDHNFMHSWSLIILFVVLLTIYSLVNYLAVEENLSWHIIILNIFRCEMIFNALSIILFSAAEKWRRGSSLKEVWQHGLVAKMYHSVASWIIEQQNCNFRDQCSMSTLFHFQREQLIIHICCGFRLPSDSLLSLKVFSKHWRKLRQIIGQTLKSLIPVMHSFICKYILCCFVSQLLSST